MILTSAHPSPLSASRGFIGNGHFKKANEWLETKFGCALSFSSQCTLLDDADQERIEADAKVDWTKL